MSHHDIGSLPPEPTITPPWPAKITPLAPWIPRFHIIASVVILLNAISSPPNVTKHVSSGQNSTPTTVPPRYRLCITRCSSFPDATSQTRVLRSRLPVPRYFPEGDSTGRYAQSSCRIR